MNWNFSGQSKTIVTTFLLASVAALTAVGFLMATQALFAATFGVFSRLGDYFF